MLHRRLIRAICNKYSLGKDVANIIQYYVLNLCCPALIIKAELGKFIEPYIKLYNDGKFYYDNDYLNVSVERRYAIARNIVGSFFDIRGKDNIIDYMRHYEKLFQLDLNKFTIISNTAPQIMSDDAAIRRRLRIIPF